MGRFIMKLHDDKENKDYYLEWSTVVDAPVTYGMSLEEFKQHYIEAYGSQEMKNLEERLARVEEKSISAHHPYDRLNSYFEFNRAGKKGGTLSKEGLLKNYCRSHNAQ